MKNFGLLLLTTVALAGCAMADCDLHQFPYDCVGQIAPTADITAYSSGDIRGVFFGYSADFTDYVRVIDLTANWTSDWVFNNHITGPANPGTQVIFGTATAGDSLVVEIWDQTTGYIYSSDPSMSADLENHAFVLPIFADKWAMVGLEDLQQNENTDWDYNDLEFFLYNVSITPAAENVVTPEPASLLLLGSGIAAALRRGRKRSKRAL